jgi:serine/threonine protein kinase
MPEFRSGLQVLNKIWNGYFGEVYLGQDEVHGRVAVKVLTRQPFHSDLEWDKHKAGFLKEAQHLSKATHRNVVQVHHITESTNGTSIRICMAYCTRGSLQTIFENGPMTIADVRKVGTDVLLGLSALHARSMLHRDIKPGNILIDAAGVAQISDFGLVTDELLLGYGSQAGYCDHIAYEVWHGKGTSIKSDLWALGMTLFRLLHGKVWYEEAPKPTDVVSSGGFADRLEWLPHIPRTWRRVIRKMLNDAPAARYLSAGQTLEALSRLPATPVWLPAVTRDVVLWKQRSNGRLKLVEWKRHSPRKHEWTAWSEPLSAGRKMTLGRSHGIIGHGQVISELETYFAI